MYVFVGMDTDLKGQSVYSMFDSITYSIKQLHREELAEVQETFYGDTDVNALIKNSLQSGSFFMRSIDKTTFDITFVSNIFVYKKWAVISNCKETLIFYDKELRFSYQNSEYYVHSLYPSIESDDTIYLDECNEHNTIQAHGYIGKLWQLDYNYRQNKVHRSNTRSVFSKWSLAEEWYIGGIMTDTIDTKVFNLMSAPFIHKALDICNQVEDRVIHSNQCPSNTELFEYTLIQALLNHKLIDERRELIDKFKVIDIFFEVTPYYQLKLYYEHFKANDTPETVKDELACINLKGQV